MTTTRTVFGDNDSILRITITGSVLTLTRDDKVLLTGNDPEVWYEIGRTPLLSADEAENLFMAQDYDSP